MKVPSNSLIRASLAILIASGLFNIMNFLYHFLSARMLGPAEYGIVASLFSMVYLLGIGATTIQNAFTKFTAKFRAKNEQEKINFLFKRGLRKIFLFSLLILVLYTGMSPFIANFLKIPLSSTLILGPFIVVSLLIPVNRGILQGLQKFNALGANMVIEGIVKLVLAILFIYLGFKANGVITAVLASVIVAFILTFPLLKFSSKRTKSVSFDTKEIYDFSIIAFIALFLVTAIYNFDIFLVKHFFSAESAGHYAALSLLGKIVFFGATSIGIVMFPKISELSKEKSSKKVFLKSILFTSVISALIVAVYFLFSRQLVTIIFGSAYSDIIPLLGMFGVAMAMLSLSYICVLNKLALGKKKFIVLLVLAVISEMALICLFHDSLQQIVSILAILNAALFILLLK